MRVIVLLGLMAILTAGLDAQSTETGVLKVSGMHCGACAATVEKAAQKVAGVRAVKASQPDANATVTYDPLKTTLEAVAKAINTATPFKAEAPRDRRNK
jgi:copper chaperone CopZ